MNTTKKGASPIFLKSLEMVAWLLAHTQKFPKSQRFVLAKRMEEAALSFQDALLWATKTPREREALMDADDPLERLRMDNRLGLRLRLHAMGSYGYLPRALEEIGRLLGGWMRSARVLGAMG